MTTKLISSSYPSGYSLAAKYDSLLILSTGYIGGTGLRLHAATQMTNYGTLSANYGASNANNGISAYAGATIRNGNATQTGALIRGYSGVFAPNAAATIANYGAIQGFGNAGDGVFLVAGGVVTNGSGADTMAEILGEHSGVAAAAVATVSNFGSIIGFNAANPADALYGVDLGGGGKLVNGSSTDTSALIRAQKAGLAAAKLAEVHNYGTISGGYGVYLAQGGTVTNGSTVDAAAEILAYGGAERAAVRAYKGSATIINFGVISSNTADGVDIVDGGKITNGASNRTTASISGLARGVTAGALATVTNFATIRGASLLGIALGAGGVVANGAATDRAATIYGEYRGVLISGGAATVTNFGDISTKAAVFSDGVELDGGGTVTNGSTADTTAEIDGGEASGVLATTVAATIVNFGTIKSTGRSVYIAAGGMVANGSSGSTTASITGGVGVVANLPATVTNFATIAGADTGVALNGGGTVVNGSAPSTGSEITGHFRGVYVRGGAGTVTNFGDIRADPNVGVGVQLRAGGAVNNFGTVEGVKAVYTTAAAATVVNGSGADRTALITGVTPIYLNDGGTLRNFGTITGTGLGPAAAIINGGVLVNGSTANLTAQIQGAYGIATIGCAVANCATVVGTAHAGAYLNGGRLTNGSATITSALVSGAAAGANAVKGASVTNFGTIAGVSGAGVLLGDHCVFVNGAAGVAAALAQGATGVSATGASATIDNFGVIYGSGGVAVDLTGAGDLLRVEAGCAFYGAVLGGGGTLVLNSGSGTISGFAHGDAGVSGAITPAEFANFGVFEIAAPASFTLAGAGNLGAGRTLVVDGQLALAGTLASAGALTVARNLTGTGTLALTAGTATFQPGAVLTVARVTQNGGVAGFTAGSLTVSHPWTQSAGTVTVSAGDKVSFTGTGNSFSGTLGGAGTIAFTGGSDTLLHPTLAATAMVVDGAAVTLSGAVTLTRTLTVTATSFTVAAAGATLSGGGALALTNVATNAVKGAASTAKLTNFDKITGAGTISDMVLVNQAGGVIDANLSTALVINTGTVAVTNAGLIESASTGGVTLQSAVVNSGTLAVTNGTLEVTGAVSGTGVVTIGGGVADFGAAFTENVTFNSSAGILELAKSTAYTGTVTGFSKTGTTSLDLADIAFGGATKASYSGATGSGTLTVTDGAHTSKITLIGNYTASIFTVSSDGHGGTRVVDPPAAAAPNLSPGLRVRPFIEAVAGFGATGGGQNQVVSYGWRAPQQALLSPRTQIA